MWLELIWWICNVLIYHQQILLIACEPLTWLLTTLYVLQGNNGKHWGLQDGTNSYTLPFCIPLPHFQYREDIYAHPCFQAFLKQFTDDYLSNHLYGQEARKVFIQHPRFNIEVFLKRLKYGRSIIHRYWPKVAKTFNMNEGSIFAFRFSSFPDEMHLTMYHPWC